MRDYSSYMTAAALSQGVFRVNPDHPGGAHYMIHAFDDALHAPLGLRAAWAYSDIAPGAPHALHMTSHIFLALGMWDQVVERNETAVELTHQGPGHYTAWLNYGLIQQGRYRDAVDRLVVAWANLPDDALLGQRSYLVGMRAHYVFGSERWDDQVLGWEIEVADAGRRTRAIEAFTQGYAALKLGRRETAGHFLGQLRAIADEPGEDETPNAAATPRILQLELEAMLLYDAGRVDEALLAGRKAARLEDGLPLEFGPPDIVKPSHELMGELLLALNRPTEASREFQAALLLAPKRSRSLLGLSAAAERAGEVQTAARAQAQLDLIWHRADPEARDRLTQR